MLMCSKRLLASATMAAVFAGSAQAVVVGELGILDDGTNGGINPATGVEWAEGDVYRLAFVTSTTRDATSPDIADYHAHVQAAADAAGLGGTSWYSILQTWNDPDRAVNAYNYGSTDVPIVLVNSTLLANDIADLNNGPQVFFNITEDGVTEWNGGVASGSSRKPGDPTEGQTKIEHGNSNSTSGQWWQVYNGQQASQWHYYAMSVDLVVGGGGPSGLPGDTDGDGDVDDSDLGTSFSNYTGPVGDVGKTAVDGDNDGDGDVDDSDLGTSFSNYTGPIAVSVPEPTSLALLGLGGLLAVRRRRA